MAEHTPGPWETGQAHWNEDGDVMYTLHGIKEAKVADCRLIAAAPDLLAVCREFISVLGPEGYHPAAGKTATDRMRTAIAKAEGRS